VEKLKKKFQSFKIIFIHINKQIKTWKNDLKNKIYGHSEIEIHLNKYSKSPSDLEILHFLIWTDIFIP